MWPFGKYLTIKLQSNYENATKRRHNPTTQNVAAAAAAAAVDDDDDADEADNPYASTVSFPPNPYEDGAADVYNLFDFGPLLLVALPTQIVAFLICWFVVFLIPMAKIVRDAYMLIVQHVYASSRFLIH